MTGRHNIRAASWYGCVVWHCSFLSCFSISFSTPDVSNNKTQLSRNKHKKEILILVWYVTTNATTRATDPFHLRDAVHHFGAASCSVYIRTNLLGTSPTTVVPYQHYSLYILARSFKHVCPYFSYRMAVYCIAPSMHTARQTTVYFTAAFSLYVLNAVL